MLLEFEGANSGGYWINPEHVVMVEAGTDPVLHLVSGQMVRVKGDGAEIARRLNGPEKQAPRLGIQVRCLFCDHHYGAEADGSGSYRPRECPKCGPRQLPNKPGQVYLCRHCGTGYAHGPVLPCPMCGRTQVVREKPTVQHPPCGLVTPDDLRTTVQMNQRSGQ